MRKTIKVIADEMGISKTTVSLALNGRAREIGISIETEKKILDYCRMHNYVANVHAQKIRHKTAKNIGVVTCEEHWNVTIEEKYCSHMILEGICMEGKKHDFAVSMFLMSVNDKIDRLLARYFSQEIDGFIFSGVAISSALNSALLEHNIPAVVIGGNPADKLPTVNINNYEMSFTLTTDLLFKGRSKIVFVPGDDASYLSKERLRGCQDALQAISAKPLVLSDCRFKREQAYSNIRRLLDRDGVCFNAVVCASDAMALGVRDALLEYGVKIPEDVALTGGDMNEYIRQAIPDLTTYPTLPAEQGRKAFELLLSQIKGSHEVTDIVVESHIITGNTSGGLYKKMGKIL